MYFDLSELTQNNCKKKVPRKQKQKKRKKQHTDVFYLEINKSILCDRY